ncbi:uncharacterized protein V6R79_019600 [Siganus canaliculatus]
MRTKVDIDPASKSTPLLEEQLRDRITYKQKASKAYTDAKRGAQLPKIKEGSLVRVRKPKSKFYSPARVMERAQVPLYWRMDVHGTRLTYLWSQRVQRTSSQANLWIQPLCQSPQNHQMIHTDPPGSEKSLLG